MGVIPHQVMQFANKILQHRLRFLFHFGTFIVLYEVVKGKLNRKFQHKTAQSAKQKKVSLKN